MIEYIVVMATALIVAYIAKKRVDYYKESEIQQMSEC